MSTTIASRKKKVRKVIAESWLPTNAMPGSAAKVEALAHRLQAGLPLWHPHDWQEYVPHSMRGVSAQGVEAGPKKGELRKQLAALELMDECDDLDMGDDE